MKKYPSKKEKKPADIDVEEVEKLARYGVSNVEMADFFGCGEGSIRGDRFKAALKRGRAAQKMRLRQLQWQTAESGNCTMQIFLGKQMLGQSDKVDHTTAGKEMQPMQVEVLNQNDKAALKSAIEHMNKSD